MTKLLRVFGLPLVIGAAVVGGATYMATKHSAKVISMVDGVRTWINKKLTKAVVEPEVVVDAVVVPKSGIIV